MARAVAATRCAVGGNAEIKIDLGCADMGDEFLLFRYGEYGPCRAYLRALGAFGTAVTFLVSHLGLKKMFKIRRGTEHSVGTGAHAELACGAVVIEVLDAAGSEGDEALGSFGSSLGCDFCQTAVQMLLLGFGLEGCASQQSGGENELPAAFVRAVSGFFLFLFAVGEPIADCSDLAVVYAVEAGHTSAVVYLSVEGVDAGGLALAPAIAAFHTLAFINLDFEKGEPAEQAENGSDGTNGVAVCTSPEPGAEENGNKSDSRNRKQGGSNGLTGGEPGYAPDYPAVCAVRGKESDEHLDAADKRSHEQGKYDVPDNLVVFVELEFLLCEFPSQPDYKILKNSHRTDYRAVEAPQQDGDEGDSHDDGGIEGQTGGEELEFSHPAPPLLAYADEEQSQSYKEQRCKNDPCLT